jgi:hypothetical protein
MVNTYQNFDRGFGSALRRNPASELDKAGPENGGRQQDDRRAREANECFFTQREEAETEKIMRAAQGRLPHVAAGLLVWVRANQR